jgi:predicted PurR-regulated permease PerM
MTKISANKKLSLVFLLLLTLAALYLSLLIAWPFLNAIVTATLLAVTIHPLFTHLLRLVKRRSAAALIAAGIVLLVILLPTVLIVDTLAKETKSVYDSLSENSSGSGGWSGYFAQVIERPLNWIESETGVSHDQLKNAVIARLKDASTWLLNWARSLAVNVTGTILDTFIMLFTLFFLLRDGPAILKRIGCIVPLEPNRYSQLLKTIADSVIANVYGVLAVSFAQSILGALGFWIAGLPNLILWTAMTALFSMIPVAGAAVVWGSGVIYLGITGHWGRALFLLVYGAGIISMADNIVRPLVLSGRVKLNPLLIFFSLLGGVQVFGIIGLFVGPVAISVTMALVKMLTEERTEWAQGPAVEEPNQRGK